MVPPPAIAAAGLRCVWKILAFYASIPLSCKSAKCLGKGILDGIGEVYKAIFVGVRSPSDSELCPGSTILSAGWSFFFFCFFFSTFVKSLDNDLCEAGSIDCDLDRIFVCRAASTLCVRPSVRLELSYVSMYLLCFSAFDCMSISSGPALPYSPYRNPLGDDIMTFWCFSQATKTFLCSCRLVTSREKTAW